MFNEFKPIIDQAAVTVCLFLQITWHLNFAIWKKYHICCKFVKRKKCQSFLYCYDHASGIEFNGWRYEGIPSDYSPDKKDYNMSP